MPNPKPKKNWRKNAITPPAVPSAEEVSRLVEEWLKRVQRNLSPSTNAELVENILVAFQVYAETVVHRTGPTKKAVVAAAEEVGAATRKLIQIIEEIDDTTADAILTYAPAKLRTSSKLTPAEMLKQSLAVLETLALAANRVIEIKQGVSQETPDALLMHDADFLFPGGNPLKRFLGALAYGYREALSEQPQASYRPQDEGYHGPFVYLAMSLSTLLPEEYDSSTVGKYAADLVGDIKKYGP